MPEAPPQDEILDVAIVGFGPTGQALAALLGEAGHRVEVFERRTELYPLPRAVHFDAEAMRLFDQLGIVDDIKHEIRACDSGTVHGADNEPIATVDMSGRSPHGWARDYSFYQPVLEQVLSAKVHQLAGVQVHRGWRAQALKQQSDHVELLVRRQDIAGGDDAGGDGAGGMHGPDRVVRARYVVGADGANSVVRSSAGITTTSHDWTSRWVVADVRPHDMAAFADQVELASYLDPARPWVAVPNGNSHRRWEFMLIDNESPEEFENSARVWELLSRAITPDQGTLVRHAVYDFRAVTADAMVADRVLLVGDAAHLMPPFAAQGLCSGLRDVSCLAWKLDFVLRGLCDSALLGTYETERKPQNDATVELSTMNAMMACITDPAMAQMRDQAMRSGPPPMMEPPGIGPGVLVGGSGEGDPIAGKPATQGRVARGGGDGERFDRALGAGFGLVCATADPAAVLGPERMEFLDTIGARIASFGPDGPAYVRDADGELTRWLEGHGLEAAISRPDNYAFGGAPAVADLPDLVDDLRERLCFGAQPAAAGAQSEMEAS